VDETPDDRDDRDEQDDHLHHHRDLGGGQARAAVFGISDGLVSNMALILGVAGADASSSFVRVAGLAGMVAGAVSMAAGEYVSMKAQQELLERELALERAELERNPQLEAEELGRLYESRGMGREEAKLLSEHVMSEPDLALEVHVREELGIDPASLGSPVGAAVWSFLAFTIGALIPLLPWFFTTGGGAVVASLILGTLTAGLVGGGLGYLTERSIIWSSVRQMAITVGAAAVTWLIGNAVGVDVT
jgi:VIT1/CCC1 family predicted Fe2+/Mn2+ transporter